MARHLHSLRVPSFLGSGASWCWLLVGAFGAFGCSAPADQGESEEPKSNADAETEGVTNVSLGPVEDEESDPDVPEVKPPGGFGGSTAGSDADECLRFMSWGSVAVEGAVPGESGSDAIVDWLNDASSASGEHFAEKPTITSEFLAPYDLILLQNLSGWEIAEDEVRAFQDWVRAGGGVMSLSGYEGDPGQVMVSNRLFSFSGMNYVNVSEAGDTSTSLGVCGYCLGSTNRQEGWNEQHPISQGISAVGAFGGRSIQGSGSIVTQEEGKILGMTEEIDAGRVFLFHDDWISYRGAWSQDVPGDCAQNMECSKVSPRETYQVARLWKNAFDWLVGGRECFSVEGVEALTDR